jgi:alpha-L-fucosidase 2
MATTPGETGPSALYPFNLTWNSPSADARGSMPIGNGDIGLNVWVEPNGDLVFFIGKTDAWDENLRLLKLTRIRVKLNPALNTTNGFLQTLNLREGVIEISDSRTRLRVWVDANHPVVQVDARSVDGVEERLEIAVGRASLPSRVSGNEFWQPF